MFLSFSFLPFYFFTPSPLVAIPLNNTRWISILDEEFSSDDIGDRGLWQHAESVGRKRSLSLISESWLRHEIHFSYLFTQHSVILAVVHSVSASPLRADYPRLPWDKGSVVMVPASKPPWVSLSCPDNFLQATPQLECTYLSRWTNVAFFTHCYKCNKTTPVCNP